METLSDKIKTINDENEAGRAWRFVTVQNVKGSIRNIKDKIRNTYPHSPSVVKRICKITKKLHKIDKFAYQSFDSNSEHG